MPGRINRRLRLAVDPDSKGFDEALGDTVHLASQLHGPVIEFRCGTIIIEVDHTSEYSRMSYAYYDALEAGGHVIVGPDAVARPRTDIDYEADLVGRMLLASIEITDDVVDRLWGIHLGRAEPISTKKARELAEAVVARAQTQEEELAKAAAARVRALEVR